MIPDWTTKPRHRRVVELCRDTSQPARFGDGIVVDDCQNVTARRGKSRREWRQMTRLLHVDDPHPFPSLGGDIPTRRVILAKDGKDLQWLRLLPSKAREAAPKILGPTVGRDNDGH